MSEKKDPLSAAVPPSGHFSGRFSEPVSELVKRFTASVTFDQRLAGVDIQGSLAHARMLARQGVISAQDLADIQRGMGAIEAEVRAGKFEWRVDLEDVHMNIESRLIAAIGDAGKRLHTGRSRNDQIATGCGCAAKSTASLACCAQRSGQWSVWPTGMPIRLCRASPICRLPSR